jgi:Holliday junction DNA helicase RuvA
MIAKIKGSVDFMKGSYVIVDVHGIGYKVFLSAYSFGKVAGLSEIELHIHTYVREDTLALYGFLSMEELEMFELLISISGIGPKAAMGILSIADPKTIRMAVVNEDPAILTKVSGVGKKIAQRVILELKNKIEDISTSQSEREEIISDSDSLEALVALGYSITQAREALKLVPKEISDVSERVKTAMKNMGRR